MGELVAARLQFAVADLLGAMGDGDALGVTGDLLREQRHDRLAARGIDELGIEARELLFDFGRAQQSQVIESRSLIGGGG